MRNLYTELAEYVNREQTLVEARCIGASVELAWAFEKDKTDPIKHYRESDLYIFASTRYQSILKFNNFHLWLQKLIKEKGLKKGLDYGGGIAETTICSIEAGAENITFLEVAGSKTMEYAYWRIKKYGMTEKVKFVNEGFEIKEDYDFIIAMDVFEHMKNPTPVIQSVAEHTKFLVCNPTEIKYNWLYPQHISSFNLNQYFREVEVYLYERL